MDNFTGNTTIGQESARMARSWRGIRVGTLMVLTIGAALSCGFYVWMVRVNLGRIGGWHVPLDVLVLDDATGRPIRDAAICLPDTSRRPITVTGFDGEPIDSLAAEGYLERHIRYACFGLLPVPGTPEVVVKLVGMRVSADGYETLTQFLPEGAADPGRPLVSGAPLPVEIRLKRSSSNP